MGKCQLCDSHINARLRDMMRREEVYLKAYAVRGKPRKKWAACFRFYDTVQSRQALSYRTLAVVFHRNSAP